MSKQDLRLNTQQKWDLGLSAFTDFLSIGVTLTGGYTQANSYNFQALQNTANADLLRIDAKNILKEANDYENQVREQGIKARGEQIATMSASGFDVSSGSYKAIIGETNRNIERNIQAIRYQAMSKYSATIAKAELEDVQSKMYKRAAKQAKRSAITSSIVSGISGAVKLGGLSLFNKPAVIDATGTAGQGKNVRMFEGSY